jgi:hypothetical protein
MDTNKHEFGEGKFFAGGREICVSRGKGMVQG